MSDEKPPDSQTPPTSPFGPDTLGPNGKPLGWYKWASWFAKECWDSHLLPDQIDSSAKAFTILCKGDELGLPPFAAWQWIYLTKARRLAIMSKGALAVVQAKPAFGGYGEWIEGEGTPEMKAVCTAKRKGFPDTIKEFSLADANAAGLLEKKRTREGAEFSGPWQAYVKDMLLSRARGRCLDVAFAAELGGIDVEGVAEDVADAVTSRREREEAAAERRRPFAMIAGQQPRALPAAGVDPLIAALTKGPASAAPVEVEAAAPEILEASAVSVVPDQSGLPSKEQPKKWPDERRPANAQQPTTCPRCAYRINALGGCDACGWPQEIDLR